MYYTLSKYFTVVSVKGTNLQRGLLEKGGGDIPKVLGNVFSKRRAKSGSLILSFMSLITFYQGRKVELKL